jgi:transposase
MALNLAPSKHEFIYDMIRSGELSISEMAGCNKNTILRISSNIQMFCSVKALSNKGGRPRSITPIILEALCDHLFEKPGLYLDEMAIFLWDEFNIYVTKSSISRALVYKGWSKKTAKVKARERNLDLRDEYFYYMSEFRSYYLVYVDESGCDKRIGFRRTGWSPLGTILV